MSEGFYREHGPVIEIFDPIDQNKFQLAANPEWSQIPEICTFSDFLQWNFIEEYTEVIRRELENGQLPLGMKTDYLCGEIIGRRLGYIRMHKVYLHGIDDRSFRVDAVFVAFFSVKLRSGAVIEDQQWYRVTGRFDTDKDSDLFEEVRAYRYEDIPMEQPYDDRLIPIISKTELDAEAERMLAKYYPEALSQPMKLNACELAKRMGYTILKARLSEDDSKLGTVIFMETEVTFYTSGGKKQRRKAKAKTILIDVTAHKHRKLKTDDTIVHECVHAYKHYLFYFLQSLYHSFLSCAMRELEDMAVSKEDDDPLKWIECQAVHMTYRVRMPLKQTSVKAAELFSRYADFPDDKALEAVITDMSKFYDVSKTAARNRLIEIGYDKARGCGQFANGKPVPGYIVGRELHKDQTYTIDFERLVEEYQRNVGLRRVLENGAYVYAEGHLCRNIPKYIEMTPKGIALTAYARTHMSECCLLFTIRHGELKDEYVAGELHRIEDKSSLGYLYEYSDKDVVGTATALTQIMSQIPTGFGDTMTFHMGNLGITNEKLSELSLISPRTVTRMRCADRRMPSTESIIAVSIGMSLYPELSQDMLKKADRKLDISDPTQRWYMVIMRTMYRESIHKCNELLMKNGIPMLGSVKS